MNINSSGIRLFLRFILCIVSGVLPVNIFAQHAEVSVDPGMIKIGQQAVFDLSIEVPENSSLLWPGLSDTITSAIEIIRFGRPDTIKKHEGTLYLRQQHIITAWEAGFHPIPPLHFATIIQGDTINFESQAILFEVSEVALDPESEIKDIKTIWGVPLTFREVFPYLLILIILLAASWILLRYFRNRQKPVKNQEEWDKPDIPAHIAAISALERLRSQKLWQQGKIKLYHSELTFIMRMYILKRFAVHAPELTTSEILQSLRGRIGNESAKEMLAQIFQLADLVKFAKFQPAADDNERSLDMAYEFVDDTKIEVHDAG